MADTGERMFRLLALLQDGMPWPGRELAERLDTSVRSLRRDIERLREQGYPIETVRGPAGYYRLAAVQEMPPLILEDEEAVAITIGLQLATAARLEGINDAARQALSKIEQLLPHRLATRVHHLITNAAAHQQTWPQIPSDLLLTLSSATARRVQVRFRHRNAAGKEKPRRVDPYRLVLLGRHWHLLGWDLARDNWHTYRLDRITRVEAGEQVFTPRPLPAENAIDFLLDQFKAPPAAHTIMINFNAPISTVAAKLARTDGTLESIDDHHCRYAARVDSFDWIAMTLAMTGLDYSIEDPPEFAAFTAELATRMTAAAGGS